MRDDANETARSASPLNPLPPGAWLLILPVVAVEAVLSAAGWGLIGGADGIGWRIEAIQHYAFSAEAQHIAVENRRLLGADALRYASFSFVHGTAAHALFGVVMLAALGKMLGERLGSLRLLILALLVPVPSAMIFGLVVGPDRLGWLFGAMPMAFGMVGAFTFLRWSEARDDSARRKAFSLIGILLGARLAFGLLSETGPAWVADVVAFALGFGLTAVVLGPGRWAATLARLRR